MRRPALAAAALFPAAAVLLGALASPTPPARAALWCAVPLVVHEWGVHVYRTDGAAVPSPELPPWFHTPANPTAPTRPTAVRDLPADSGIRAVPVLHFYTPPFNFGDSVPLGVEVGFTGGPAAAWFPAVDTLRQAALANGPDAVVARASLLAERAARALEPWKAHPSLPADPTRQLVWDRLDLVRATRGTPAATDVAWVEAARALGGALWVQGPSETERFVFYEAATREALPLTLARDAGWAPGRRAYRLANRGKHPVHDVFVVHRDGARTFVFEAPRIAPGGDVAFVLEDHATTAVAKATTERLRALLVDDAQPAPPSEAVFGPDCPMMRDPAQPVERAEGHRLYRGEVDLVLATWGARLFEQRGTNIVYREDPAALDEVMPLSLYTDMFHFVQLRRAGLALWEQAVLP